MIIQDSGPQTNGNCFWIVCQSWYTIPHKFSTGSSLYIYSYRCIPAGYLTLKPDPVNFLCDPLKFRLPPTVTTHRPPKFKKYGYRHHVTAHLYCDCNNPQSPRVQKQKGNTNHVTSHCTDISHPPSPITKSSPITVIHAIKIYLHQPYMTHTKLAHNYTGTGFPGWPSPVHILAAPLCEPGRQVIWWRAVCAATPWQVKQPAEALSPYWYRHSGVVAWRFFINWM